MGRYRFGSQISSDVLEDSSRLIRAAGIQARSDRSYKNSLETYLALTKLGPEPSTRSAERPSRPIPWAAVRRVNYRSTAWHAVYRTSRAGADAPSPLAGAVLIRGPDLGAETDGLREAWRLRPPAPAGAAEGATGAWPTRASGGATLLPAKGPRARPMTEGVPPQLIGHSRAQLRGHLFIQLRYDHQPSP